MSIPKEPRQMMINMMYLVLTALLAMNVSAEILNAFHVVNEGIVHSNNGVDSKNGLTLTAFSDQLGKDKDKTQKWYDKAMLLKGYVDVLNKQLDEYSDLIVEQSGGWVDKNGAKQIKGWKPELGELSDDKNLEVSTRLMIEEGRAEKLQKAIEDTRAKLLSLIDDPALKKQFEAQLPLRIDQPQGYGDISLPPRAAYSHSDSLGNRNSSLITSPNSVLKSFQKRVRHFENAVTCFQSTPTTG